MAMAPYFVKLGGMSALSSKRCIDVDVVLFLSFTRNLLPLHQSITII